MDDAIPANGSLNSSDIRVVRFIDFFNSIDDVVVFILDFK